MHTTKKNILLVLFLFIASCENTFENFGDNDTDEAILYQAKLYLAEGEWDNAIAEFVKLPAATLAEPDVQVEYASAYSGKCGLDFLTLADNIETIGTSSIMQMLLNTFAATTATNLTYCQTAETMLKTIADVVTGVVSTERGRYLMAFSSLAKIGAIISFRGDPGGDNTIDATWDPCDGTDGLTDLPDADADEVVTAIALFKNNIAGLDVGGSVYTDLDTVCDALPPAYNFCSVITTAGVNANYRIGVRSMIREGLDGLGFNIGNNNMDTANNALVCSPM